VAVIVVTPTAQADLAGLIQSHSLPASTVARFRRSVEPLASFPLLGSVLEGRWSGLRFVLGPWRWMIVVYIYDQERSPIAIITIQDGRSARAATAGED
jgi:plasmid stabilization system protein ParE